MADETPEQKAEREAQEAAAAEAAKQTQEAATGGEKTFSQADLDRIIQERLDRQKATLENEAKTAAERAKLDETERLKAENGDAVAAKDAAEQKAAAAERKLAVVLEAAKANVPGDRLERFVKLVDADEADPTKAVKATLTEFPEFAAKVQATGGEFQKGGQSVTKEQFAQMTYPEKKKLYQENPDEFARLSA